jgi:two-component system, OmpR family, KDP operon response regulator KdpE
MMKVKVLVIATDHGTQRLLVRSFPKADFQVCSTEHDLAIETIEQEQPDILLTEYEDLCTHIRQRWLYLPIIVLLDATQAQYVSQILDSGADDCVMKPFGPAELEARIRAHIRRTRPGTLFKEGASNLDLLCSDDGYISMSISGHKVFVGGQQIHLTKIEFELLRELMTHAEKVLTHRLLLQRVWGTEYGDEADYIRIYIRQLRCKVEPNPSRPCYILTEMGVGYVFRSLSIVAPYTDNIQQFTAL